MKTNLIALLVLAGLLVSCGGGGGGGSALTADDTDTNSETIDRKNFAVDTVGALPTCSADGENDMAYVIDELTWYRCQSLSWAALIQYSTIIDVSNVSGVAGTDYDQAANATWSFTLGTKTDYYGGATLLSFSAISTYTYSSGGDTDTNTDSASFSVYVPDNVTYTVPLGRAYRNSAGAFVQMYIYFDGTTVYLYADDGDSSIDTASDELVDTLAWESII